MASNDGEYILVRGIGGGPRKFWSMCCSIGPPKTMFYCIFKEEFWRCVVRHFLKKIWNFEKIGKFDPQTSQNSLFIAFLRSKVCSSVLFSGSKRRFCVVGTLSWGAVLPQEYLCLITKSQFLHHSSSPTICFSTKILSTNFHEMLTCLH